MFKIEVPRKRPRNALFLAQAMGLMLKPRRIDKRRKRDKSWKKEQW